MARRRGGSTPTRILMSSCRRSGAEFLISDGHEAAKTQARHLSPSRAGGRRGWARRACGYFYDAACAPQALARPRRTPESRSSLGTRLHACTRGRTGGRSLRPRARRSFREAGPLPSFRAGLAFDDEEPTQKATSGAAITSRPSSASPAHRCTRSTSRSLSSLRQDLVARRRRGRRAPRHRSCRRRADPARRDLQNTSGSEAASVMPLVRASCNGTAIVLDMAGHYVF